MTAAPDPYATLGLLPQCTLAEVKAAYRKLARKNHPDMSKSAGAEERFKNIAQAYATLKDPEKRAAYDASLLPPRYAQANGHTTWPGHTNGAGRPGTGRTTGRTTGGDYHPFDDLDLSEFLASMGQGADFAQAPTSQAPQAGADIQHTVHVTLAQASQGTTLMLDVLDGDHHRSLEVTLPAGVVQGQRVRLLGRGGKGSHGGANGNIYLHVALKPDNVFNARGHDLYFDLLLSPWEAMLGTQIKVPTLESDVMLTIAPLTQAAQTLRLKGRGMNNGQGGKGDLFAKVRIVVPASLSANEQRLVQELFAASTFAARA